MFFFFYLESKSGIGMLSYFQNRFGNGWVKMFKISKIRFKVNQFIIDSTKRSKKVKVTVVKKSISLVETFCVPRFFNPDFFYRFVG